MKLLSTTQAAEILGVNDSRIRQLIRDGQLQAVQVGRAYLLDETAVHSFQRPPMGRPKKEGAAEDDIRVKSNPVKGKRWKAEQQTLPEVVPTKKKPAKSAVAPKQAASSKKGGKK